MILIDLKDFIDLFGTGNYRNIMRIIAKELALSERTVEKAMIEGSEFSGRSAKKINDYFNDNLPQSESTHDLEDMGPWGAFLHGWRLANTAPELFPNSIDLVIELSHLDKALYDNRASPARVVYLLQCSRISDLLKDDLERIEKNPSEIQQRECKALIKTKVMLYIIACFDAELLRLDGHAQDISLFNDLFYSEARPKKIWLEAWMKKIGVKNKAELAILCGRKLNLDPEITRRYINRCINPNETADTKILNCLIQMSQPEFDIKIDKYRYYVALILQEIFKTFNCSHNQQILESLAILYSNCFDYWRSSLSSAH